MFEFNGINRRLDHLLLKLDQMLLVMLLDHPPFGAGEENEIKKRLLKDYAPDQKAGGRHFVVSSRFLGRAYNVLMQHEEESLVFGCGVDLDNTSVVDEIVTFDLEVQSMSLAKGDFVDSTRALIDMSEQGYVLRATLHCHPGAGKSATLPSSTDFETHRRLEGGGYEAIGVIMTRDGFVRFFSDTMPFSITVVGDDVEMIDSRTFHIEDIDSNSDFSMLMNEAGEDVWHEDY